MRILSVVILVFVMTLLCAYQRSRTTLLGYEIAHLERQKRTLASQIANMQVEIGKLKSPQRIAKAVADLKLDLHSPESLFEEMQKMQLEEQKSTVVALNGR